MIKKIKSILKRIFYQMKFYNKSVKIFSGCQLSAGKVDFEGMNVLRNNVIFRGRIGYGSYIGEKSEINAIIGRFCSISSEVKTISGTHPTKKFVSTHPCFFSNKKQSGFSYVKKNTFQEDTTVDKEGHLVKIGNDVWIGANVLLLPGIFIGDGAIIAAGSVVTKDVAPYSIVGGIPAKEIKKRFTDEQIQKLLRIKWWDKSLEWISKRAYLFGDIDEFLKQIKEEDKNI